MPSQNYFLLADHDSKFRSQLLRELETILAVTWFWGNFVPYFKKAIIIFLGIKVLNINTKEHFKNTVESSSSSLPFCCCCHFNYVVYIYMSLRACAIYFFFNYRNIKVRRDLKGQMSLVFSSIIIICKQLAYLKEKEQRFTQSVFP